MKKNVLSVLFGLFFSGQGALAGGPCEERKCEKLSGVDVCFVAKDVHRPWRYSSTYGDCGFRSEKYDVGSASEIEDVLKKLASECKFIQSLTFNGHGTQSSHSTGLKLGENQFLKSYTCLVLPGLRIKMDGCNNGKSCPGQIFMYDVARNLLNDREGSILSPTTIASTVVPGLISRSSLNGVNRLLTYKPNLEPADSWDMRGVTSWESRSMAENCQLEMSELLSQVALEKEEAKSRHCAEDEFYISDETLAEFSGLAQSISPTKSWDYHAVSKAVRSLETQRKMLLRCRPKR